MDDGIEKKGIKNILIKRKIKGNIFKNLIKNLEEDTHENNSIPRSLRHIQKLQ